MVLAKSKGNQIRTLKQKTINGTLCTEIFRKKMVKDIKNSSGKEIMLTSESVIQPQGKSAKQK